MPLDPPDWYGSDDLSGFERWCWSLVSRGVKDRRSPFHTPTLATVGDDGRPDLRTLVLRGANEGERTLRFHTDRRAGKLRQIVAEPRVAVHFYDAGRKLQLRMDGRASFETADAGTGAEAWERTRDFSRACYRVQPAPGSVIEEGHAYAMPNEPRDAEEGRENFAVLLVRVDEVEALYLAASGHRRARFGDATWLVP